jgi:hypothetical protein
MTDSTSTKTDNMALEEARAKREDLDAVPGLSSPEIDEFFESDVLEIVWIVNSTAREYVGAELLLGYGGPTTRYDTRTGTVTTYWGSDSGEAEVLYDTKQWFDQYLGDLYESMY